MRQRPRQLRRPSNTLRAAAAVAAAAPVLVLAPAAQASPTAEGHPDLVVSRLPTTGYEPGEVRRDSVTITNNGSASADGILFRTRLSRGLAFPGTDPGCTYTTLDNQVRQADCHLDVTVDPGATVTVPVPVKVLSKALMEVMEYGTSATGSDPGEGDSESYHYATVRANSSADLAAVGDRVKGRVGRTVTVTPALRNDGPGWVRNNESDDQPALLVHVPAGTVAVQVPKDCSPFNIDGPSGEPGEPGRPQYVCYPPDYTLEVGSVHSYRFKLKIKKLSHSTSAQVKATSVYDIHPEFDHNAANDTASVSVSPHGHGHGHAPGSGSSPAPNASATGGASATSTAEGGDHPGAESQKRSAVAAAPTGSSDDGDLAGTGASSSAQAAPYVVAAALGSVGLGGLLFLALRRRRRQQSAS